MPRRKANAQKPPRRVRRKVKKASRQRKFTPVDYSKK